MKMMMMIIIIMILFLIGGEAFKFNVRKGLFLVCSTFTGYGINILSSLAIDETMTLAPSTINTKNFKEYPAIAASELQLIELFDEASPSVVYINTFSKEIDVLNMNVMNIPVGEGSGIVFDTDGHIVTNYHVIKDAVSANVIITSKEFKTNQVFKAEVTGVDPDKDIAVLKINVPTAFRSILRPIKLGTSSNLRVGALNIYPKHIPNLTLTRFQVK